MMQTDLFSAPPPATNQHEKPQAVELKPRDQTSNYYTIILDNGYRITYNKEIKT